MSQDETDKRMRELTSKLITEERAHQRDISFLKSSSVKRDVMILVTVVQRNSVNGNIVLSDATDPRFEKWSDGDPFRYRPIDATQIEMMAREIPMHMKTAQKFINGAWAYTVRLLIKMNVINAA